VAGWVSVTVVSMYQNDQTYVKFFQQSGSPIIEAFGTPYADTKFQGNPFMGGV